MNINTVCYIDLVVCTRKCAVFLSPVTMHVVRMMCYGHMTILFHYWSSTGGGGV